MFGKKTENEKFNENRNRETANSYKALDNEYKKINNISKTTINTDIKKRGVNASQSAKDQDAAYRKINSMISNSYDDSSDYGNPYSDKPANQRASKKDVLSLSSASYGNSLLEKLVANSNHVEYQNAVLKFQEKQVELLTTIANSVVAMGKVIVTSEAAKAVGDTPEYQRNVSTMAKALGSGDWATAASEGFGSIWKKIDRSGYTQIVTGVFDLFKSMVEDGKIKEMFKDTMKNFVLDNLPGGMGNFMRSVEKDSVGALQKYLNQGSVSSDPLKRVWAKDFAAFNPITLKNQKLKVDYSEKAIFTKKTDKAITEVIPEYLAEILATLRNDEARLFDYNENKFIGRTELALREQKANESKSWKTAMHKGNEDFKDMVSDIVDVYGEHHNDVGRALKNIFKDKKGADGKYQFKDESSFNVVLKKLFEKYGRDAIDILATPDMDLPTVMKQLFGSDQAMIQMYSPIVWAMNQMYKYGAADRTRSVDIEDSYYQIFDFDDDAKEGRNAFTQYHSGDGSLGGYGSKAFEKGVRDFSNKSNILGQNSAAAWGALKKMSMGNKNLIDSAINSDKTYVNTNVVYINANQVIGGGKFKKGKGGGGWNGNFPKFGPSGNPADDFKRLVKEAESWDDAQTMSRGDATNYYEGRNVGFQASGGNFGDAYDQEEWNAANYKKYEQMMTDEQRKAMGDSWKEISPDMDKDEIDKILKARKAVTDNKIKWDAALQVYAVFDHAGYTKGAYESVHGPTSNPMIDSPMWFLDCIDDDGNMDEKKMADKANKTGVKLGGLDNPEVYKAKRKEFSDRVNSNVKGSGPEAALNMLGLVYKSPQFGKYAGRGIATMGGLAIGAIMKDKGIIKSDKGIAAFGLMMNALYGIPSVKNTMDMLMGPEADVKDRNGYTNRQKAMAKVMSKLVPLTGFGMGAGGWFKIMSKMGPAGMALGLIGAPFAGFAGMALSKGMSGAMGQWLFGKKEKDAGWFSKLGKALGGFVPAKLKRLITGGGADNSEASLYAQALKGMRSKFDQHLKNNPAVGDERRGKILEQFDKIVSDLEKIDPEDDPDNTKFGRLRDEAEKLMQKWGADPVLKGVDSEFDEIKKENEFKTNSNIDLRKADYAHADDEALAAKLAEEQRNGNAEVKDMTLDEYRKYIAEQALNHFDDTKLTDRYDKISEDMKSYLTSIDISVSDIEDIAKKFEEFEQIPITNKEAKSNAYHNLAKAMKGLDPETVALILNGPTQGALRIHHAVEEYVASLLGTEDSDAVKAFINQDKRLSELYNADKIKAGGWNIGMLFRGGKEKVQDAETALKSADVLKRAFDAMLDPNARQYTTTQSYDSSAKQGERWKNEAVSDNVFDEYQKFTKDVNDMMNDSPSSGSGFTTPIKDRRIPKELLNILGFTTKSKWGMDDFSKTTIGGRSGSAVGCSVATMNNILKFLNLPEISTNSLATIANLHTNSTGVKFSFFKYICNRMGLAFAVYNSNKNRFNHNFFKAWEGAKDKAYAVLLNNYNGSGHFVFCADYKDGKLKMIDPIGKGREERISVNDIAVRASIVITITKTSNTTADRNFGSFGTGYGSPDTDDYDEKDIDEDDGIISGAGSGKHRMARAHQRKQAEQIKAKTSRQRKYVNDGHDAGTAAVLAKLTAIQSIIAAAAIVNANNKQQAKKIQSTANKIDPDTKTDASALNNLTNSPEVVQGQTEENKAEEAMERTAEATEAMAGAKPGENPKHAYKKMAKQAGAGILSTIGGLPKLLASLAIAGGGIYAGWKGLKYGANLVKTGWNRFKHFTVDNMMEESRDQQIDPATGEVIDNGHFKDVSSAIQGGRDMMRYGRAGAFLAKGSAGFMLKSARFGANALAKFGDKAGKIPGVGSLIQKFLSLPVKLCDWILKTKLGKWLQEKGLTKTLEWFRGKLHKLLEKIAPKLSKKIAEKGAKKGATGLLKRLPGIGLTILLVQAFYAAYQGYKHAGQLLKVDDSKVTTGLRVKTMFAKLLYDVGPELLVALLKLTPGGFAGFALDIAIIVLKEMITWDVLVDFLGLGAELREQKSEEIKDKATESKVSAEVAKAEKEETADADSNAKKEAQEISRSRDKAWSEDVSATGVAAAGSTAAAIANNASSNLNLSGNGLSDIVGSATEKAVSLAVSAGVQLPMVSTDKEKVSMIVNNVIKSKVDQYSGRVKYGMGSKDPDSGQVDCSGWVSFIFRAIVREFQANNIEVPEKWNNMFTKLNGEQGAAGITAFANIAGGLVRANEVKPEEVKPGMIIGLAPIYSGREKSRTAGRFLNISHIAMVYYDSTGAYVTESAGKTGVRGKVDIGRYLLNMSNRFALYIGDPFGIYRGLMSNVKKFDTNGNELDMKQVLAGKALGVSDGDAFKMVTGSDMNTSFSVQANAARAAAQVGAGAMSSLAGAGAAAAVANVYSGGGGGGATLTSGTGESVSFDYGGGGEFKANDPNGNWNKLKGMFVAVSKSTGIPVELLTMIAAQESGFDPNIKAKTTSATGLFQIIGSTWSSLAPRLTKEFGIQNPNIRNPLHNTLAIALYMKDNAKIIKNAVAAAGKPLDAAALYSANFFGAGGAKTFFEALARDPNTPMTSVFKPNVIAANKWLAGHTTGSLYNWLQEKMNPNNPKNLGSKYAKEAMSMAGQSYKGSNYNISASGVKAPMGLLESDISTPSGKSGYSGVTSTASASSYSGGSGSDRGGYAASSSGSVAKASSGSNVSSPSVQVTNNTVTAPQDGVASIMAKMSTNQTTAIVGALNNLATLLQNILKELSNNNTEAMRQAAAGAK